MEEYVISITTGIKYKTKDGIGIVDPKQQKLYVKHNIPVYDVYTGLSSTGQEVMVMVFDRKKSYPYYLLWKEHELK